MFKVKQLNKEFGDWENKLTTFTTLKEVEEFMKRMELAISQQSVTNAQTPNKKPYPLGFWLTVGVMIIDWIMVMRGIWKKKKVKR